MFSYDCANLLNSIKNKFLVLTELSNFVENVDVLFVKVCVVSFVWCARSTNGVAHHLVLAALLFGDWGRFFL